MLPLTLLILVMVWLYSPSDVDPVREIDPAPTLSYAASVVSFDVQGAGNLPAGWRPTSARAEPSADGGPVVISVGYVTPSEEFARVVQSAAPQLLADVLGDGFVDSDAVVEGWRAAQTADGEQALLRSVGSSTVIVTGSGDTAELRVLADALRPVSR